MGTSKRSQNFRLDFRWNENFQASFWNAGEFANFANGGVCSGQRQESAFAFAAERALFVVSDAACTGVCKGKRDRVGICQRNEGNELVAGDFSTAAEICDFGESELRCEGVVYSATSRVPIGVGGDQRDSAIGHFPSDAAFVGISVKALDGVEENGMMADEELRFGGNAGVNRGKGMIQGDERSGNGRITVPKKEAHGIKTKSKPRWREALQG